jgi:hypothetical protein
VTTVISWLLVALGAAMIVRTASLDAGFAVGYVLGAVFLGVGVLRLWLTRASRSG